MSATANTDLHVGSGGPGPTDRVELALARIDSSERPEAWIAVVERETALAQALAVEQRLAAGERLPLAGATVGVKDNIDVAGLPTTAGCPAFAYTPAADATAVARLRSAGAIILGKTNLDQFATGLVGTRSPYGAVRDARDPRRVAGGSSSGSAVAVALGEVELALGTDTAGSGRVPAAFQGIVGVKPTRGLVPTDGLVPACRSFDCISVFAATVAKGQHAMSVMAAGPAAGLRPRPLDAPLAAPPVPRVAVASAAGLEPLSVAGRAALAATVQRLAAGGAELAEIDIAPFLSAGELLYGGGFLAERYAAVGPFILAHPEAVDRDVAEIILAGAGISAADYLEDRRRLSELRAVAADRLGGFDALLLPTAPFQPTLAEVAAAPIELNARLGVYSTFANLLDLCAVSVPAGEADGGWFGVTLFAPAFADAVVADLGSRLTGEMVDAGPGSAVVAAGGGIELLVIGAHLRGQPLNGQLTERGGRFLGDARTAGEYRLFALDTTPPKPGLVREAGPAASVSAASVSKASVSAASVAGELWALPPAGLASLLACLPSPMALGPVRLEDGRTVVGFLCEPAALAGAEEITAFGGWSAYLERA